MKNKIIKFLVTLGLAIAINVALTTISSANLSITTSKSTVSPGETFSVTVSVSSDEAGEATLNASNGTLSQKSIDLMSQSSVTVNCTAGNSGTINITASGTIANYKTETEEKQSASKSVTINTPTPDPEPEPTPTPSPTPSKSSDTSLKSLTVSPFGNLKAPYDITVDNKYDKVTISAVPNHSSAKVSGKIGEFSLEEGTNQFKITVTAEDGSQQTYSVYVRRKVAETTEPITPPNVIEEPKTEEKPQEPENNNDELGLTNLVITGIELNPSFKTDVYEYKAEFSENIDTLEILATPNIEGATLEIVGNSNLKIGENLITIILKSEDGETTKTYQILVTKNEPEVTATSEDNNVVTGAIDSENLKNKVGKIILIAVAAVIAVILMGIIAIVNTRKKSDEYTFKDTDKKEKVNKNDFKVAVNEEESYRELEKLSNIRNGKNELANDVTENTETNLNENENNDLNSNDESNETEKDKVDNATLDAGNEKDNMNALDSVKNISTTEFGEENMNPVNEVMESGNVEEKKNVGATETAEKDNYTEFVSGFGNNEVEEPLKTKKGKSKGKRFK